MPESAPILVVFGIGGEGKDQASRLGERAEELALRAATPLSFGVASIENEASPAITEALAHREIFARAHGNDGVAGIPEPGGIR